MLQLVAGGGLKQVEDDTTPILGGDLDGGGHNISNVGAGQFGSLVADSPTLVVDEVNHRVGIGRAAPRKVLSVNGRLNLGTEAEDSGLDGFTLALKDSGAGVGLWRYTDSALAEPFIYVRSGKGAVGSATQGGGQIRGLQAKQGFRFTDIAANVEWMRVGSLIGIMTNNPTAQLHIDQSASGRKLPVLRLDQADVDDTFIDFIGASAADGSRSISSDVTEDDAKFGALRVEINGVTKWVRIYDGHS